jgi:hypothetical protein
MSNLGVMGSSGLPRTSSTYSGNFDLHNLGHGLTPGLNTSHHVAAPSTSYHHNNLSNDFSNVPTAGAMNHIPNMHHSQSMMNLPKYSSLTANPMNGIENQGDFSNSRGNNSSTSNNNSENRGKSLLPTSSYIDLSSINSANNAGSSNINGNFGMDLPVVEIDLT